MGAAAAVEGEGIAGERSEGRMGSEESRAVGDVWVKRALGMAGGENDSVGERGARLAWRKGS